MTQLSIKEIEEHFTTMYEATKKYGSAVNQ